MSKQPHSELVCRGTALHDRRQYARALPFLAKARARCPTCPDALYNLANTLHMLERDAEACELLHELLAASDEELETGCDVLVLNPRPLRLDAYFLLFLSTLAATGEWRRAAPFLRLHLRNRSRGVRSLWSKSEAIREAESLRASYAPRAKPVAQWVDSRRRT